MNKAYTKTQLKDMPCERCGTKPSTQQWSICADDNKWRPLCDECDVDLNALILLWFGFKNYAAKMRKYAKRLGLKWRGPYA